VANRLGWSAEEAAEQLGIGRSIMFELIKKGEVRSVKIGKRRIVPDEALREYMSGLIAAQCSIAVAVAEPVELAHDGATLPGRGGLAGEHGVPVGEVHGAGSASRSARICSTARAV